MSADPKFNGEIASDEEIYALGLQNEQIELEQHHQQSNTEKTRETEVQENVFGENIFGSQMGQKLDLDLLRMGYDSYSNKHYDTADAALISLAFFMGMFISWYARGKKNEKVQLDYLLKKFQGQKHEFEYSVQKTKSYEMWKYRIKLIEKVVWTTILIFGFIFYRNPIMLNFVFVENGMYSICGVSSVVILFNSLGWHYEQQHDAWAKRQQKLKSEQKDIKMQLLTQMDPLVVETLRSIVRKDMKGELQEMQNSELGCSQKCQLMKKVSDKEYTRNNRIVSEMLEFAWCDICSVAQPGAVSSGPCKQGCGQKLVQKCIPHMQKFGREDHEIAELQAELERCNDKILSFQEYRKAKKQYAALSEQEKAKQVTPAKVKLEMKK